MRFFSTALAFGFCMVATVFAADGDSCTPEGKTVCNSDGTWSMCGSGYMQNEGPIPAGMACDASKGIVVASAVKAAAAADALDSAKLMAAMFQQMLKGTMNLQAENVILDGTGFNMTVLPKSKVSKAVLNARDIADLEERDGQTCCMFCQSNICRVYCI